MCLIVKLGSANKQMSCAMFSEVLVSTSLDRQESDRKSSGFYVYKLGYKEVQYMMIYALIYNDYILLFAVQTTVILKSKS